MTAVTDARPPLSSRLIAGRLIAVLRAASVDDLLPVCDVLAEEGVSSLELTLTTPGLLDRLTELVTRYEEASDVGVGTITSLTQARRALDGGADYLVTPTTQLDVVSAGVHRSVPVMPGGLTPTELAAGWAAGASAVKVFPAQTVGPGYVDHLRGPFPDIQVIPSGGVDVEAAHRWLDHGAVAVSVGGPLLGNALRGGSLTELRLRCRELTTSLKDRA